MHHTLYARIVMPQHTHFMHDNTPEGHVTSRIRRVVERYKPLPLFDVSGLASPK